MSAGAITKTVYESGNGLFFPVKVQPETLTFTLNGVANTAPANSPGVGLPSASVSHGRRAHGVNCRLIRFKITGTLPPGYKAESPLTLPVLQASVYAQYDRNQTGTYTLNGIDYTVEYIGKTPETVK